MDAQELRNLQEAYSQVYENQEQLDEALTGERYKQVMNKPGGTAYSRKVSADPSKRATRGGRGGESDFGAGDRGSGNAAKRRMKEDFDLFDIILEYLVAEGYADTNKAALAIMANMSEEWKQSIVEEVLDEELTGERVERAKGIMATASKGKAKALNRVLKSREGSTAPGGQPSANIKGDGSEQKLPTKRGGGGIRGRAKVTTIGGSKMDQRRGNRATRRAGGEVEDTSDEN